MFKKSSILFVLFFSFILFSCGEKLDLNNLSGDNFNGQGEQNNTPDEGGKDDTVVVSIPKISPAAGDYAEGFKTITITVDSNDSSIDIFYTTDGSEPDQSSNRYTEPFTILGSKTVRAIAFYKKTSSAIATANYNLNAGKTASQLGVIKGTFNLAENLSDEVKTKLASSKIYISSSDLPGVVREGKMGDSFYIDTLDTTKSYDFYFSNKAPGTPISSRAAATIQTDSNGEPVLAIKIGVKPSDGAGTDLGKVTLKPTGTIIGKAFKYSETGELETDHAGITVFIPGTSYAAYTDRDGNFSMSLVPQGMYTIRAMYAGYTFAEQENILLSTDNNDEPRAEVESEFALYYAKGTVKGSVLLSDRTSDFAGINIVLADSSNIHSYSAATTSTGSWTINDVTPGTYSVEFHKDGYVDQKVNDIIVSGARITEIPRIVLKEDGGSIFGKVLVGNSSIAGVSLIAERPVDDIDGASSSKTYYALSKDDGSYRFESVAPGLYTVTAIYPGYKSVNQSNVSVSIGDEIGLADLIISEKTTYTVTGSCVLAGMESGFEGTSVLLQSADNNIKKSTTTNTEGTYTIADIDAGSYILTFSRSGFITNSSVTVDVGTKSIAVVENVVLYSNAGTVTGTVTLESAESFEGIAILLTRESDGKNYSTVTDSAGHFAVAGVAPGTYRVQATKSGYNTGLSDPFTVSSGTTSSPADQQLSISLRSLYGTVTLEGRTDYTGVRITATKTTSTTEIYSALSNKEGFYALSGMTPGEYILSYAYEGYRTPAAEYASLGDESSITLDSIELERATGRISGIVNIQGTTDYSGILVTIVGTDYKYTTQADGTYSFTVPTGNYIGGVKFEKEGYQLTVKGETLIVLADRNNEITTATMYSSTGTVTGTVTLESAAKYDGIDIVIYAENNESVTSYSSVTDSEGHFAVSGMVPGTYRIQATKKGFTLGNSDPFILSAGETVTAPSMNLSISRRALYGTVTLEERNDFTGVRITATKTTDTTEIYSALSNRDGFYALSGMTPGEYILSFSYEGYRSYTSPSVSLNNNSSIDMDEIELAKATGKISGIVNLEGCTDHSGITVSLVGTDYTATTNADGSYEFTVPIGNYPGGVRFEKADYQLTAHAQTLTVLTDSTYGIPTVEMKATANTIKGLTTIAGAQNSSGIKISVDGLDSETYYAITDQNGNWVLEHIPLGYQTLRFSAINVPDVTSEVKVIANDYITVSSLEMIPDSATLKGFVFLDGMSDSSGITVTVSTYGKDDIVVRTTSDGAFTVNNILASGSHIVTFSKEGWNSQNLTINDFEPLEERAIGLSREYVLTDTTAPAWNSTPITINNGANFANNTKLHVDLHSVEKGSGIDKMSIQITRTVDGVTSSLYPSTPNWQNYKIGFDFEIGDLPDQYVGNGTYKLYIALKDKRGNVSTTENKSITLTNLVTSLAGVLTGDKLHLTEENSPYLVEGDCIVSEGQTLVIDSGVEVRFASGKDSDGNTKLYSISISGSIEARGKQEKKILFTKAEGNEGIKTERWKEISPGTWGYEYPKYYWNGIAINGGSVTTENTYRYVSGNIMEYCEFEYANTPLTIKAGAYINKCYFHDCFSYVYKEGESSESSVIINNIFENGIELNRKGVFVNNNISSSFTIQSMYYCFSNSLIRNNTIKDATVIFHWESNAGIQNNVFENCSLTIGSGLEYEGCDPKVNNNNFIDCSSPIISANTGYQTGKSYDFTHNYWGAAQTDELNNKGNEANISFISDYYDNFNYARIDYSNWATEPFENCGYSETGFVAFDYTVNSFDFSSGYYPESSDTSLSIEFNPQYYENPVTQMRLAQSYEELKNTSWKSYSSNTTFTVDKSKLINGAATIYVQVKDDKGNASSAVVHNIPYDIPVVSFSIVDGTSFGNSTKKQEISYYATDLCNITAGTFALDGSKIYTWSGSNWGTSYSSSYSLPLCYMASGTHTLTMTATDSAGNTGEKTISFTINRSFNASELEDVSYDTTTGQLLKDEKTLHLWHLDNDGKEDFGTAEITNYTHTNGGFEGSASYLSGSVPIDVSTNSFTVEFWTRGTGQVYLTKQSELELNNYFNSTTSYSNYMYHYYKTEDSVSSYSVSASARFRADDKWHYWTYIYDSSYTAIYCDGVCVSYQDGFNHNLNTNNNTLSISANGIVDELRISNCARSADEISSYYKTAKPILDANTGSLEAIVY